LRPCDRGFTPVAACEHVFTGGDGRCTDRPGTPAYFDVTTNPAGATTASHFDVTCG